MLFHRFQGPLLAVCATFLSLVSPLLCAAENAPAAPERPPFFAVCMDTHDSKKRNLDQQHELLASLGYDGMKHLGLKNLAARVASAERHKLRVVMVYWSVNVSAKRPVPPDLAQTLECLKGKGTMLALNLEGGKPSDAAFDAKAADVIREVLKITGPLGVRVVLYPHYRSLVETVADCVRVAQPFTPEQVGVVFNLCHWGAVESKTTDLSSVIKLARPRLAAVITNGMDKPEEMRKSQADMFKRWIQPLDSGSFDQRQLFEALDAAGWRGPVGVQSFGIRGDAQVYLTRSIKKWRELR
ncbi:MAG: sugar phosphate isomerase/epimerase [Puniceicoccales bacterium]|jgi:sugar phosphate isomerase/epimerase|nr:sugar phosphate isomerase/epimerase [Puniceicoccales bacterium]